MPPPPPAPPAPDFSAGWQATHFLEPGAPGGITGITLKDFATNVVPQDGNCAGPGDVLWQPTLQGGASFDAATGSVYLDGVNDYIDLGTNLCVCSVAKGFTVVLTIRPAGTTGAAVRAGSRIFEFVGVYPYTPPNDQRGYIVFGVEAAGTLRLYSPNSLTSAAVPGADASNNFVAGRWSTIVVSVSNNWSFGAKMWVNGNLLNPSPPTGALFWQLNRQGWIGKPNYAALGGVTPVYFAGNIGQFQARQKERDSGGSEMRITPPRHHRPRRWRLLRPRN